MNPLQTLQEYLSRLDRLAVCYSGGTDSTFLLKVAHGVLGDRVTAIIADVVVLPRRELAEALALAERLGVDCRVVPVEVLAIPELQQNRQRRCYYCKKGILGHILAKAAELGITLVADGKNLDDAKAYRPGAQAAAELGVISPLHAAGLTKADIRRYSRELGLPTWDKPANACLATRLPYDSELTPGLLGRVERAEELLHRLHWRNVRVRVHGDLARIEVPREQLADIVAQHQCVAELKALGFRYVTLDLEGFRSGSMDG